MCIWFTHSPSSLTSKFWLTVLGLAFTIYVSDRLYEWIVEPTDGSSTGQLNNNYADRLKRHVDPVDEENSGANDPNFGDLSTNRFARKILNESESFDEVDGKKKPKSVKSLNKNYEEAKQKFFAPPPTCRNRTDTPAGGAADAGGGAPPAPAAADATTAPFRRKKRDTTNSSLPYCDEVNKSTTPATVI